MYSSILKIMLFTFIFYKTTEAALLKLNNDVAPETDDLNCFLFYARDELKPDTPYSTPSGQSCDRYECINKGLIRRLSCDVKGIGKRCKKINGNKKLPYPDCCDTVRCFNDDGITTDY